MNEDYCCGEIITGETTKLVIRQKSNEPIEIGDILVEDRNDGKIFLQVFDLLYGSQISRLGLENISGMSLEGIGTGLDWIEPHLRNYILAIAKSILHIATVDKLPRNPKVLPNFMGPVRRLKEQDLNFLSKPKNPLYVGKVRTGSKTLNADIYLDAVDVFSHHILVPATTGRGKSNLIKIMLWNVLDKDFCGILILDAHNEYYGKHNSKGLRDHRKAKDYLIYYSPNPTQGGYTLVINLRSIRPNDFRGITELSEPQQEAMDLAYNTYHEEWISIILKSDNGLKAVKSGTLNVLRRKFDNILGIYFDSDDQQIKCRSKSFSDTLGESTIDEIVKALRAGKKVVVDTSVLDDQAELLIGGIIADKLLHHYKKAKEDGNLENLPVISIVIEEAPRVLSEEVLRSHGNNIYSDIAREGRKFKIGLTAVTQLTSVIPKTILANMNTKIILGNELAVERSSVIQSASQDLSSDDRNIASLDKGEAIISSNFTKFAIPIKIPLFEDIVKDSQEPSRHKIGVVS